MPAHATAPRHTLLLLCATLAACGGGGGDDSAADSPPPPLPSGVFGKVTGTHAGLLLPGTYTLANCRLVESGAAVPRKLRLGADGSMAWLDAAQADAVLLSLVPSDSEYQSRIASVQRSGSRDTENGYGISFERIVHSPVFASDGFVQVNGTGARLGGVQVRYRIGGTEIAEQCNASDTVDRVATVPMRFSTAIAHEKMASLVALNGGTLAAAPYSYYGAPYTSVAFAADGSITTQAANAAGPTPWGNAWVEGFVFDSGLYREQFNGIAESGAGSPANPAVQVTLQHPTLLVPYPNVGAIGQPVELRRNTGSGGAAVQFFAGSP